MSTHKLRHPSFTATTNGLSMRFEFRYFLAACMILFFEIIIATTFSSIPSIRGSASDFLVVILIYYFVLSLKKIHPSFLSVGVFIFACAIELGQYFHFADLLGFKRGSLMSILLGNTFSWGDIIMYGLGSLAALATNTLIFKEISRPGPLPSIADRH